MSFSPALRSRWRTLLVAGLLVTTAAVASEAVASAPTAPAGVSVASISGGAGTSALKSAVRLETPVAPPPPEASPAPGADPSGAGLPVGNLPGWRQIFADDFSTPIGLGSFPAAASAKWGAYPWPWKDTSGYGRYSPKRTVSVAGGVLTADIHTDVGDSGTTAYPLVAALTPKLPGTSKYGLTYGRFAVRFRADMVPGYKIAWMLWPDSGNQPADGEIDFPEMNLDSPNVFGFVHRTDASSGSDQMWAKVPMDIRQWHTAVIEWSPGLVVFVLDGKEIGRTTTRVPDAPMHWVLQTETALRLAAPPAPTARGNVQVDWVAAWAYDPQAG
jgi:hypothetical protein